MPTTKKKTKKKTAKSKTPKLTTLAAMRIDSPLEGKMDVWQHSGIGGTYWRWRIDIDGAQITSTRQHENHIRAQRACIGMMYRFNIRLVSML